MKQCTSCNKRKTLDEFQANRESPDGKRPDCKTCCAMSAKEYRSVHAEKVKSRKRSYYERNKEKIMAKHKVYRLSNREKVFHMHRKYREANRSRIAEWWTKDPRGRLGVCLRMALRRRPTENAATLDELMQLWRRQSGRCAVSGLEMTWKKGRIMPQSISLDRIDSERGYELSNLRLVCFQVNCFRGKWSDAQMMQMAQAILSNQKPMEMVG